MEHRHIRSDDSEPAMVDEFDEPKQSRASEDIELGADVDMITQVETRSYAERLRMIILLSLLCWALVIAGVAAVIA